MTTTHTEVTAAPGVPVVSSEAYEFFVGEAYLLDERRFDEWLGLLCDDYTYRVPIPIVPDQSDKPAYAPVGNIIEESRRSIETWVRRLNFSEAWAETPPQRVRRFLHPSVLVSSDDRQLVTDTSILLTWTELDEPSAIIPGKRRDVLRREGNGFRLASRVVYVDPAVITVSHFRILF